ncbi:MAG: hypothetical protein ACFFGZ_04545 [Candidatus Thorarchaeota archaeon]
MPNASTHSVNKILIELTKERQEHIAARHPEFADQWDLILEVISESEEVYAVLEPSELAFAALKRTNYLTDYTVVYYKEISKERGFVITAHPLSEKRKERLVKKWRKAYPE